MKINKKYNGSIIGAIATLISLLLTFTIVVPILSTMPVFILKGLIGIPLTSLLILAVNISLLFLVFKKSKQIKLTNRSIMFIMLIGYFAIHSLGFLIFWGIDLGLQNDGQIGLAIFPSYVISSFGLFALGILIDIAKYKFKSHKRT